MLWPESEQERARNSLSQAITVLRRELAVDELVLGTAELRLNPDVITSDVSEFETAFELKNFARAVELYSGPFLDGVFVKNAPEFERWVDAERARLEHRQSEALEHLARAATDSGDVQQAVKWWRMRAAIEPTSTSATTGLVRALVHAGDRDGAIRQAKTYAALVRSELGAEPDESVMRLVEQLRAAPFAVPDAPMPLHAATSQVGKEVHSVTNVATESAQLDVRVASQTTTASRRIFAWATGLALAAIVAIVAVYSAMTQKPVESKLVLVPTFENLTGDTTFNALGSITADYVRQGLAQTGLVTVADTREFVGNSKVNGAQNDSTAWLNVARKTGAGMLVLGRVYKQLDTLVIRIHVVRPRDGTTLYEGTPITGTATDLRTIMESTRQRVMGAFAVFEDPHFTRWQQTLLEPPRYDAYQEFVAGMETLNRKGKGASEHFFRAARLDSTFVQAKLWAYETRSGPVADSLLNAASAQSEALSPYDRAALDFSQAERASDRDAALAAARRMTELAPTNDYALVQHATAALFTNRFDEALGEFSRADVTRDWVRSNFTFWSWDFLTHHYAGDHAGELREIARCAEIATIAQKRCRDGAMIALAALGREASVDSLFVVTQSLPDRSHEGSYFYTAAGEYRAHGHIAEELRALERARRWYAAQQGEFSIGLHEIDWELGNWAAVRDFVLRSDSTCIEGEKKPAHRPGECMRLGVAAAHLGDTVTAKAMIERIAAITPEKSAQRPLLQGIITAALGDRVRALRLIEEAIARGYLVVVNGHWNTGLDPLRGWGPFDALSKPRT